MQFSTPEVRSCCANGHTNLVSDLEAHFEIFPEKNVRYMYNFQEWKASLNWQNDVNDVDRYGHRVGVRNMRKIIDRNSRAEVEFIVNFVRKAVRARSFFG